MKRRDESKGYNLGTDRYADVIVELAKGKESATYFIDLIYMNKTTNKEELVKHVNGTLKKDATGFFKQDFALDNIGMFLNIF